jgi:hypothetical protein
MMVNIIQAINDLPAPGNDMARVFDYMDPVGPLTFACKVLAREYHRNGWRVGEVQEELSNHSLLSTIKAGSAMALPFLYPQKNPGTL